MATAPATVDGRGKQAVGAGKAATIATRTVAEPAPKPAAAAKPAGRPPGRPAKGPTKAQRREANRAAHAAAKAKPKPERSPAPRPASETLAPTAPPPPVSHGEFVEQLLELHGALAELDTRLDITAGQAKRAARAIQRASAKLGVNPDSPAMGWFTIAAVLLPIYLPRLMILATVPAKLAAELMAIFRGPQQGPVVTVRPVAEPQQAAAGRAAAPPPPPPTATPTAGPAAGVGAPLKPVRISAAPAAAPPAAPPPGGGFVQSTGAFPETRQQIGGGGHWTAAGAFIDTPGADI